LVNPIHRGKNATFKKIVRGHLYSFVPGGKFVLVAIFCTAETSTNIVVAKQLPPSAKQEYVLEGKRRKMLLYTTNMGPE
jgi:hypothetical protein